MSKHDFKASRIDYIFVSKGIDQMVKNVMFLLGIQTDHRACQMMINLCKIDRGVGFWKFNNQMLEDENFKQHIIQEINDSLVATAKKSSTVKWEVLKSRLAKCCKNYSRVRANDKKEAIASLVELINDLESNLPLLAPPI